jgi:hypothetical protein
LTSASSISARSLACADLALGLLLRPHQPGPLDRLLERSDEQHLEILADRLHDVIDGAGLERLDRDREFRRRR